MIMAGVEITYACMMLIVHAQCSMYGKAYLYSRVPRLAPLVPQIDSHRLAEVFFEFRRALFELSTYLMRVSTHFLRVYIKNRDAI